MDVDEQGQRGDAGQERRGAVPHHAAHLVDAPQPLRRLEERARVGNAELVRAGQGLVAEDGAVHRAHDGLEDQPQRVERAAESGLEPRAVRRQPVLHSDRGQRLALEPRHPVEPRRVLHGRQEIPLPDRLLKVAEGPVLERLDGRVHPGVAGDQQDGHVEVSPADLPQELDAVDAGHVDVRQHDLVLVRVDEAERLPAVGRGVDLPAGLGQHGNQHLEHRRLVVHDQHPAAGAGRGRGGVRVRHRASFSARPRGPHRPARRARRGRGRGRKARSAGAA